jgi:hypothetical protein
MVKRNHDKNSERPAAEGAAQLLRKLRESRQAVVLSINGQVELAVKDPTSYQQLLELVDRLESIEAIRAGLKEVAEGNCLTLEEAKEAVL